MYNRNSKSKKYLTPKHPLSRQHYLCIMCSKFRLPRIGYIPTTIQSVYVRSKIEKLHSNAPFVCSENIQAKEKKAELILTVSIQIPRANGIATKRKDA